MFSGKREEELLIFRDRLVNNFASTAQTDRTAAQQFSSYIDGNAYRFWSTLDAETKKSFPLILHAFDQKYTDELNQAYWQQRYKKLTYPGWQKETLDDYAARIQEMVAKAWPDYESPTDGAKIKRDETRAIKVNDKFWETMSEDIQQKLYYELGNSDAPLQDAIAIAKKQQTSVAQAAKEEQSYETICQLDKSDQKEEAINALSRTWSKAQKRSSTSCYRPRSQRKLLNQLRRKSRFQYANPRNPQKTKLQGQNNGGKGKGNQNTQQRQSRQQTRKGNCHCCGKPGHYQRDCWYNEQEHPKPRESKANHNNKLKEETLLPYYEERRSSTSRDGRRLYQFDYGLEGGQPQRGPYMQRRGRSQERTGYNGNYGYGGREPQWGYRDYGYQGYD